MKFQGMEKVGFLLVFFAIGLCSCGPCSSWWGSHSSAFSITQSIAGGIPKIGPVISSIMGKFISIANVVNQGGDFQCIDDRIDKKIAEKEAEYIEGKILAYKNNMKYIKRNEHNKQAVIDRLKLMEYGLNRDLHEHYTSSPGIEKVNNFVFLAELHMFVLQSLVANDYSYDDHAIAM